MAPNRTPQRAPKVEVIELSSDSEPEAPVAAKKTPEALKEPSPRTYTQEDYDKMPLLRIEGIKYGTQQSLKKDEQLANEAPSSKLPVRAKDTGSTRHRHVSIEIPLGTSSMLAHNHNGPDAPGSEDVHEDVFKTPMERRHITFDDSDHEEFATPLEGPLRNPLESTKAKKQESKEEEEEDSDDEAPPEAVSSHAAGANIAKASQAAAKAAQQQAAAEKQKRKERDAFLKKQAEQKKSAQMLGAGNAEFETREPASLFPEKRKREVPKILPLELLESDDEDDMPQEAAVQTSAKRQKMGSGWIAEPKAPRDRKVGSTVFRVVENARDKKLAPKAKKATANMRQELLRRGKQPQVKKGFFVKGH